MTSQSTFDRQPLHNAFVGREREQAELRAGLDDVSAGHGRLFLLSGEPGIGKTRLAEEISSDASARGMRVVWGRCWEGGGAPAYWPFIQILRACTNDRDDEHLEALLGSGASEIARLIPELKRSLPSLEEAKTATDSESARFRLFDAVATLLKNVARSRPLLMVVDDIHDADQPTLQMLRFIARETKSSRILIVGTYRDAEVRRSPELGKLIGDLIREGRTVSISGLSQAEVGEFIERKSAKKADDKLVADLYQATAGSPFFVDGVVRLLAAEGKLERSGFDGSAFKTPHGVRESVRRRMAMLPRETVSLLSIASAIGNEFESRVLEQVSGSAVEQIVEQMEDASRAGIVVDRATRDSRHQFSHALIRKALYEDLTANRRFELHFLIGEAIEKVHKDNLQPHMAALAHHFREAGNTDKAIDYSIRAGEAAAAIFAFEDAVSYWGTALESMKEHNHPVERQARLLVGLGLVQSVISLRNRKGVEYLEEALKLYESLGRQHAVAKVHAHLGSILSSIPSAIVNIQQALEHYRAAEAVLNPGRDLESLGGVYAGLAQAAWALNRTGDCLSWSQRAIDMSERIGDQTVFCGAAAIHGYGLFSRGKLADALSIVEKAYDKASRSALGNICAPALTAGLLLNQLCDPREAQIWYRRALANPGIAQFIQPRRNLLIGLALSCGTEGDLAEARRVALEIVDDGEEPASDDEVHGIVEIFSFFNGGLWERAEAASKASLDMVRRAGCVSEVEIRLESLALVRFTLGDLTNAESLIREALELCCAEKDSHLPGELAHRARLALVYAWTSRLRPANEQLIRCGDIIANGEDWRGLVGVVAQAEAVVAAAEKRYESSEAQFKKAIQIFQRYHLPFREAEALQYWGRALNASDARAQADEKLDAAIEIYRRCGRGERWVERIEKDRARWSTASSTGERRERRVSEPDGAVFTRHGDYWTVSYEGQTSRLRDAKGLHYIAHLLRHPGENIRALDLVARIGGAVVETSESANTRDLARSDTVVSDLGNAGEMLDAHAKTAYERRLRELRIELEEAREEHEPERADRAQGEIEGLLHELKNAIGLAGRDRRAASSSERARIAVTKAIRLSLNKIAENDASLGKLLLTTIKTGTVCAYLPDDRFPVSWRL